ncbi:MAG: hypothetical protein IJP29_08150 [Lachnospiraceae bacterium]|nr:hypothetical protein [Lachnospiraceae bacterium]
MEFVSELLMYLFKFVVYIAVTIVAVLCGIKLKKNKLAKAAVEAEATVAETTEKKTVDEIESEA